MIAKVKFTPRDPQTKGGVKYTDAKIVLTSGEQVNIYAQEGTKDWDALQNLSQDQVIEVETYQPEGRDGVFYRLTEEELQRVLNGEVHPVNYWAGKEGKRSKFDMARDVMELYEWFNDEIADGNLEPTPEMLTRLVATTYIQYNDQ